VDSSAYCSTLFQLKDAKKRIEPFPLLMPFRLCVKGFFDFCFFLTFFRFPQRFGSLSETGHGISPTVWECQTAICHDMVIVEGIKEVGLCEHHLLPILMNITIA
jgi:hypothetical protein